MAENFHRAAEVVSQGSLEVLAPARRSGREPVKTKGDGSEIEASIEPAAAVEAHFLCIEFVEVVKHAADAIPLVIVERMLVERRDGAAAIEHEVFADQAAGVGEAVGELLVRRKQKQARSFSSVCADDDRFGFLELRVAFFIEIDGAGRATVGVRFDAMDIRIGANFAAAGFLRCSDGGGK